MPFFSFTDASGETFVFRLTEAEQVSQARAILDGTVTDAVHVAGTVVKTPIAANIGWSFHIDPASVFFFEFSIEVSDSTMRLIENDLDAVGGAFLPGGVWTGWSSELVAELETVRGTNEADDIALKDVADPIAFGRGGDDTISGSAGQDHIVGGAETTSSRDEVETTSWMAARVTTPLPAVAVPMSLPQARAWMCSAAAQAGTASCSLPPILPLPSPSRTSMLLRPPNASTSIAAGLQDWRTSPATAG